MSGKQTARLDANSVACWNGFGETVLFTGAQCKHIPRGTSGSGCNIMNLLHHLTLSPKLWWSHYILVYEVDWQRPLITCLSWFGWVHMSSAKLTASSGEILNLRKVGLENLTLSKNMDTNLACAIVTFLIAKSRCKSKSRCKIQSLCCHYGSRMNFWGVTRLKKIGITCKLNKRHSLKDVRLKLPSYQLAAAWRKSWQRWCPHRNRTVSHVITAKEQEPRGSGTCRPHAVIKFLQITELHQS